MAGDAARAKQLFLELLELEPGARGGVLAERCAGDEALAARVRGLLAADVRAAAALPSVESRATRSPARGERIGPFRLIEILGEGGFGEVWRAEQEERVRRTVALKLLRTGVGSGELLARFEVERQALALMDHPNIARVLDGGEGADGRPWFAMELVDGVPITRYCEEHRLSLAERLELFATVCRAVQHAHQKGVIHRDLKPSNVLVAKVDGAAVPKVIDFGIAKAIGQQLTDSSVLTRGGQFLGTPAYMSPEQAGARADVDTRSDLYSLGVLLYEMLAGQTPFGERTFEGGILEIARVIREVEPPPPSARLAARARETTGAEAARLARRSRLVRGDLDWITMRCLAKDREERYASVSVLAQEIERHLRGDPVLAGPPALSYRLSKLARRHRAALFSLAAMLALIVGGAGLSLAQALRATRAEARSARAAERAGEIAAFLHEVLTGVDPAVAREKDPTLLRMVLERASERLDAAPAELPEVEASLRTTVGGVYYRLGLYPPAERHLARALELYGRALGEEHAETLNTADVLAAVLFEAGRTAEAEPLFERVVEARLSAGGARDAATLRARSNLATLSISQGRLDEAEATWREVLEARRATLGEEHPDTLLALGSLARVLDERGADAEAAPLYERVLAAQVATLGADHPHAIVTLHNLASCHADMGRHDLAREELERALELAQAVLPAGHPRILSTMNGLASVQRALGELQAAEGLWLEALGLARDHLQPSDPRLPAMLFNLGRMRSASGRHGEALELLEEAWELWSSAREASLAAAAADALALALLAEGRVAEAEPHARAAATWAGGAGAAASDRERGLYRLHHARVLASLGRRGEGLELLRAACADLEAAGAQLELVEARAELAALEADVPRRDSR